MQDTPTIKKKVSSKRQHSSLSRHALSLLKTAQNLQDKLAQDAGFFIYYNMKIALIGANGKLGKAVCEILEKSHKIFKIDLKGGDYTYIEQIEKVPDVIVDVSCAEQSVCSASFANVLEIPLVIACTGHDSEQLDKIQNISKNIPIFLAYNMSVGMQVFKNVAEYVAENFSGDVHIHETHHRNKKDAPSGTALELKKLLNSKNPTVSYARGGNIIGEHEVDFFGENETITLTHTALSRTCFAEGVAKATEWIVKQPNGLYNMQNLVKKTEEIQLI